MPRAAQFGSLPFQQQIDFFRQKINLPTSTWTDLWEGMHARAFVIAGATKDELLADFRSSIDKAIAEGTTLDAFRKDFDKIVAAHGWSYNGSRGWRSRVIYETNLRSSYATARYKQLQEVKTTRPFWRYVHSDAVENPRPEHKAWGDKPVILAADDPWWDTHYPPNGWGCQCTVHSLSQRDLEKLGLSGPQKAPEIRYESKTVGIKGPNPRTVQVPEGIDPGWGYNPGKAAYGQTLAEQTMEAWRASGAEAWERLTPGDSTTFSRPARVPLDIPRAALGSELAKPADIETALKNVLGSEQKAFTIPGGPPILVDAAPLSRHLDPARSQYLPFISETLSNPFEVWMAFERHKGTGRYELRYRVIKAIDVGGDHKGMLLVAQAVNGRLEAWTFVPVGQLGYLEKQRVGELIYGRD